MLDSNIGINSGITDIGNGIKKAKLLQNVKCTYLRLFTVSGKISDSNSYFKIGIALSLVYTAW